MALRGFFWKGEGDGMEVMRRERGEILFICIGICIYIHTPVWIRPRADPCGAQKKSSQGLHGKSFEVSELTFVRKKNYVLRYAFLGVAEKTDKSCKGTFTTIHQKPKKMEKKRRRCARVCDEIL